MEESIMRAPNSQGCALYSDRNKSIVVAGDILRNCVKQLEAAAHSQHQVEIEIHVDEVTKLRQMYPQCKGTQVQLCQLLNDTMAARKMPYEFSLGDMGDGTCHYFVVFYKEPTTAAAT